MASRKPPPRILTETETITTTKGNPAYLRKVREQAGVSLRAVAQQCGYSAPYVSDLERGNRTLSVSLLEQFEAAIKRLRDARKDPTE